MPGVFIIEAKVATDTGIWRCLFRIELRICDDDHCCLFIVDQPIANFASPRCKRVIGMKHLADYGIDQLEFTKAAKRCRSKFGGPY